MSFDRDQEPRMDELDMFVIDVLRHDIENIAAVLRMLNNSGPLGWRRFSSRDFTREVKVALARLIEAGVVSIYEYDSTRRTLVDVNRPVDIAAEGDSLWLKLDKSALALWNKWELPKNHN